MGRVHDDNSWSLKCEVKVLEAKNVELKHPSELFVRCYLSAGTDSKVPINTQEISSVSNEQLHWDECFSLECLGDINLINTLRQEKVIFELRRRSTKKSVFKKLKGSSLIGRVEVAWNTVLDSADMKIEQWFPLVLKDASPVTNGLKPPMIRVGMKIQIATMKDNRSEWITRRPNKKWDECGCSDGGCYCLNDDLLLVLGASMFESSL
ncbi:hypothetical protein QQ045_007153 [Rhodiola kirilowii]